jgi:hypothetical protein
MTPGSGGMKPPRRSSMTVRVAIARTSRLAAAATRVAQSVSPLGCSIADQRIASPAAAHQAKVNDQNAGEKRVRA